MSLQLMRMNAQQSCPIALLFPMDELIDAASGTSSYVVRLQKSQSIEFLGATGHFSVHFGGEKPPNYSNRVTPSTFVYPSVDDPSVPFNDHVVSLPDLNYTLQDPIPVTVGYEEGYYLVSDDRFLRYGTGGTLAEAKKDYSYALLEYLDDLIEMEDCLAPHLAQDLQELRNILVPPRS